jgi:hypothetical protein
MRIAKAVSQKRWNKVKALQWLLTHSFSAKLLAVKRVSTNKGSSTPGIDGVVWRSPTARMKGALSLKRRGYRAHALQSQQFNLTAGLLRKSLIECLSRHAGKLACTVLRREGSRKASDLSGIHLNPLRAGLVKDISSLSLLRST